MGAYRRAGPLANDQRLADRVMQTIREPRPFSKVSIDALLYIFNIYTSRIQDCASEIHQIPTAADLDCRIWHALRADCQRIEAGDW